MSIIFIHNVSIHVLQFSIIFFALYHIHIVVVFIFQAVYNANKFAKFVRRRDRLQNWLDYYQLKFQRHPDRRPTVKVCNCYEYKKYIIM